MRQSFLWLAIASVLILPISAQAQIAFSEKTAELDQLEASVNHCAVQQTISSCLEALSQTHVLQNLYSHSENSSDRIMRNAVMLLPLYVLAERYDRKGRQELSCGYAQSGIRQFDRLVRDLDLLVHEDPEAFKNIDKLKRDLQKMKSRFDEVFVKCE